MCFSPSQIYEASCDASTWASSDPAECACQGKGWMLSNVDTWHQCPVHGKGVPHPYEEELRWEVEWAAEKAGMTVEAYLASFETKETEANVEDDGVVF